MHSAQDEHRLKCNKIHNAIFVEITCIKKKIGAPRPRMVQMIEEFQLAERGKRWFRSFSVMADSLILPNSYRIGNSFFFFSNWSRELLPECGTNK